MRKFILFFVFNLCILLVIGCKPKSVEYDISDAGVNLIQEAAPSSEYAIYISSQSLPNSIQDFEHYDIYSCTGEEVGNRAIQVMVGIRKGINGNMNIGFAQGENSTKGIMDAIQDDDSNEGKRTIVLTTRKTRPPKGAVELIFK